MPPQSLARPHLSSTPWDFGVWIAHPLTVWPVVILYLFHSSSIFFSLFLFIHRLHWYLSVSAVSHSSLAIHNGPFASPTASLPFAVYLLPFLGGICIPRCIILGRLSLITVKYDQNPSFFDGAAFPPRNRRSSPDTALVPRKSGCIRVTIRPIGGLNNTLLAHSCREGNNTSVTVA